MMHISWPSRLIVISSILAISIAMNRPVYKIVLNSKGYAQFIQYDVNIPTLREFTLCVWVRVTSLENVQTIFTYIGNDDKRIMRLWLDSGGRKMWISLDHDRVVSSEVVNFPTGVWRAVCLSYQADFGAWALYIDAKLVSCEGSPNLQGFELPGDGSLIFGYGSFEKGSPTGLTGEIYGVSMILSSTIERNINMKKGPWYRQKASTINKINTKHEQENNYIILGDLQTDEIQTVIPLTINKDFGNYFPHSTVQHSGNNVKMFSGLPKLVGTFQDKKFNNFSIDDFHQSNDKTKDKYSNQIYRDAIFNVQNVLKKEQAGSSTRDLPIVLEYETPPPILPPVIDYFSEDSEKTEKSLSKNHDNDIMLSEVEKPPPPEYDSKVYGQWTSSKFAGNVLNYLRSINFNAYNKKKVPSTLPKMKLSDSYPYPSEFTLTKISPPINYKKRTHFYHKIKTRDVHGKQINLQVIKPDVGDISKILTKYPDPKVVEVTNRGEPKNQVTHNTHKNIELLESMESSGVSQTSYKNYQHEATSNIYERHRGSNLMNILPFLKSNTNIKDHQNNQKENIENYQVYSNSLSKDKNWYNVNSYDNDIPQSVTDEEPYINAAVRVASTKRPFGIKYKPDLHKEQVKGSNDDRILYGRALAKEVSNQAKQNIYNIPLLKFKIGSADAQKNNTSIHIADSLNDEGKVKSNRNHFNKNVKLGNALNEQFIIGNDERQIKNTFLGGDDKIPDINRHRSRWYSKGIDNIPSSLGTRTCNNIELYVQEDESIRKSKILSPVHQSNIAIEFIEQSYKKCSISESNFKDSPLLLIDWMKTPVKLFGGAYPKKTKDLCGFF